MDAIQWLTDTELGAILSTVLVSMVPVLELRGGIPWGVAHGLPHFTAFLAAVVGNMIPLPGTGGWTGALIAAFLDMRLKKALPSIFGGVLIAGFLITGLTYGFTSIF